MSRRDPILVVALAALACWSSPTRATEPADATSSASSLAAPAVSPTIPDPSNEEVRVQGFIPDLQSNRIINSAPASDGGPVHGPATTASSASATELAPLPPTASPTPLAAPAAPSKIGPTTPTFLTNAPPPTATVAPSTTVHGAPAPNAPMANAKASSTAPTKPSSSATASTPAASAQGKFPPAVVAASQGSITSASKPGPAKPAAATTSTAPKAQAAVKPSTASSKPATTVAAQPAPSSSSTRPSTKAPIPKASTAAASQAPAPSSHRVIIEGTLAGRAPRPGGSLSLLVNVDAALPATPGKTPLAPPHQAQILVPAASRDFARLSDLPPGAPIHVEGNRVAGSPANWVIEATTPTSQAPSKGVAPTKPQPPRDIADDAPASKKTRVRVADAAPPDDPIPALRPYPIRRRVIAVGGPFPPGLAPYPPPGMPPMAIGPMPPAYGPIIAPR